jgi:hypothetical protein
MVLSYLIYPSCYDNYYLLFDCDLYFYLFSRISLVNPCFVLKFLTFFFFFFTNCMHDIILIFFFPIVVDLIGALERKRSKEGDQL